MCTALVSQQYEPMSTQHVGQLVRRCFEISVCLHFCIMKQEREVQRLRADHRRDGPARARIMVRSTGISLANTSLSMRNGVREGLWTRASVRHCVCAPCR